MSETASAEKPLAEKPLYLVLNKTIINMRDVVIARKAKDGTKIFVFVMKGGYRDQETIRYDYEVDFEKDWNIIVNTLLAMNS